MKLDIQRIQEAQREMVKEREWEKFHTPKNLAVAATVEASELAEVFQWMTDEESLNVVNNPKKMQAIRDEIADVLFYLLRISDILKIDVDKAFWEKFEKSKAKYPVEKSKGNSTKYNEFE